MPASLAGRLALGMLPVPPEFTGGHHPTFLWVLAVHIFHSCRQALEPSPKPTSLNSLRVNGGYGHCRLGKCDPKRDWIFQKLRCNDLKERLK